VARRLRTPSSSIVIVVGLCLVALYGVFHSVGTSTFLVFGIVVPSIILHELSHGVAALACGDDTARRAGRLTLNPLKHVDPVGTLVLPAVLALSGFGAFGYAKPVPINPRRMRHPRNDSLLVSLAGPACNLVLAGISIILLRDFRPAGTPAEVELVMRYGGLDSLDIVDQILFLLGFLNVSLAVFNLIPIPPLDGSAVIERVLPPSAWPAWSKVRTYGMLVLLVIVLLNPHDLLGHIFDPAERAWGRVLAA
jgi:Zn-dependent protease